MTGSDYLSTACHIGTHAACRNGEVAAPLAEGVYVLVCGCGCHDTDETGQGRGRSHRPVWRGQEGNA